MSIIEKLMDGAEADVSVLQSLNEQGDNFSAFRDVDFLIEAKNQDKAEIICSFINDFNYGTALLAGEADGFFRVQVVINMPVQQNIINSVAGFMTCIASLFDGELNGWGCAAQK
jgi:hypothetical protein